MTTQELALKLESVRTRIIPLANQYNEKLNKYFDLMDELNLYAGDLMSLESDLKQLELNYGRV